MKAVFENSTGLRIGDNIKISGINIGKVIDLKLDKNSFESIVYFQINSSLKIPEDSQAKIKTSSLLGGYYVDILPGNSKIFLKENETIYDTTGSVSLTDLVGKMIFSN